MPGNMATPRLFNKRLTNGIELELWLVALKRRSVFSNFSRTRAVQCWHYATALRQHWLGQECSDDLRWCNFAEADEIDELLRYESRRHPAFQSLGSNTLPLP